LGGTSGGSSTWAVEKREENKKVQTARRREKNGAKRTKDKENDRSESEIINSG
jgi:hypothetical protein